MSFKTRVAMSHKTHHTVNPCKYPRFWVVGWSRLNDLLRETGEMQCRRNIVSYKAKIARKRMDLFRHLNPSQNLVDAS